MSWSFSVSYRTLKNDKAARPPLQIVPNQVGGEKRKEKPAVKREPMARPILALLRRVGGCAIKIAAAIETTERAMSIKEVNDQAGEVDVMIDARTVKVAVKSPPAKVMSVLDGDAINADMDGLKAAEEERAQMAEIDRADTATLALEGVEVIRVGKGEGMAMIETMSARYPMMRLVGRMRMVRPSASDRIDRRRTENVATFDPSACFHSSSSLG